MGIPEIAVFEVEVLNGSEVNEVVLVLVKEKTLEKVKLVADLAWRG